MQKKLIFVLALMILVTVFALQNSMEVMIRLWFWSVQTSMVLVLILTFAAGALVGILFSIPGRSKIPEKTADVPLEITPTPSEENDAADHPRSNILRPGEDPEFEDVNN